MHPVNPVEEDSGSGGGGRELREEPVTRVVVNADDANMVGSTFHSVNMSGVSIEDVNLSNAKLRNVTLAASQFNDVAMSNVVMAGRHVEGMAIDGMQVKDLIAARRKGE